MVNNVELKRQFERVRLLAHKHHDESRRLDILIKERWGCSYSYVDFDSAIDTLDYGTGWISFYEFVKELEERIKKQDVNVAKDEVEE